MHSGRQRHDPNDIPDWALVPVVVVMLAVFLIMTIGALKL